MKSSLWAQHCLEHNLQESAAKASELALRLQKEMEGYNSEIVQLAEECDFDLDVFHFEFDFYVLCFV